MPSPDRTALTSAVRGALATAGPLVTLGALELARRGTLVSGLAAWAVALGAGAATSVGALALGRSRRTARLLVTAGIVAPAAAASFALVASPALAFVVGMGGGAAIGAVWLAPFTDGSPPVDRVDGAAVAMRWSSYVTVVGWIAIRTAGLAETGPGLALAACPFAIQLLLSAEWIVRAWRRHRVRSRLLAAIAVGAAALSVMLVRRPEVALNVLAAVPLSAVLLAPGAGGWLAGVVEQPARLLVVTFLLLSLAGTVLLALPEAAAEDTSIGALDAAFTAVSAVCVTGLVVVDTPTAFSRFGEATILLLIQVGGLGIMTFYTAALAALGRRLSIRHESAIAGALSIEDRGRLFAAVGRVLRVTFATEGIGALVLFAAFLAHHDAGDAAWRAVFTSVSAFCNAGFALQSDSLIPYASDPVVIHTVAVLIIVGGLSPAVVAAIPAMVRRRRVSLQAKLILTTTAVLLVLGFVAFAAFEWTNTLGGMPTVDRLGNAWFQSVTLRTAGFNSVDVAATRPATQTMMIAMMFIGGSPGGTAGGAKTTTVAVLVLAVVSALRRHPSATAFHRRLRPEAVYQAAAVVTLGLLSAVVALISLQLTQRLPLDSAVFEVVSALGTVGLSLGATAELDAVGKVLIMACMFAGRVGPLTLFLFLTEHGTRPTPRYPAEDVDVG